MSLYFDSGIGRDSKITYPQYSELTLIMIFSSRLLSIFFKVTQKAKVNGRVPGDIFSVCITLVNLGLVCLGFFSFPLNSGLRCLASFENLAERE